MIVYVLIGDAIMNDDLKTKINFLKYKRAYFDSYYNDEKAFINRNLFKDNEAKGVDILAQVYSRIGAFDDNEDRYKGFVNKIVEDFDINCNILEVAAGRFPIVSYHLSKRQISGSITAYDPRLVAKKLDGINLVKKRFTFDDNIDLYDLLIGLFPCDVTETLVKKSCVSGKDFIIGLCGCTIHFPTDKFDPSKTYTEEEWFDYIYSVAEENKRDYCTLSLKYLDENYECNYPIIEGKHKRKVKEIF